ncbi:signal transduction histidine kinase [Terrimicrobium sacchariphilum]|jgi:signal transduction histidine kinase|uniref:histidine kinase n=1 Tax=Terrimicrobium sacchariphilum TaxID=690879 RepID=A0A146G9M5_TERSA|nr:hybrid sensor histidine kinase/response regulator [Terrimicrobium sacchariphilum]GAT34369.1 signal transduction histidine kinase [Terrimicrobium sacchariphilum]
MALIYLVEDDEQLREYATLILSLHDHVVRSFAGGAEVLLACDSILPDLVLCDVRLPGLSGFQILERFRLLEAARHIPFIFISAHVEREQIRKGMNLGADDYLTKPFTESELVDVVRTRLALHDKRRRSIETHLAEMNARALRCLSHEIRTPLNGVMGGLELMQMDKPDAAPEELGIVATSAVRLERTLLRYLSFMEAASDSLPLRSQELVDVDTLVAEVASRIAESCSRLGDLVVHAGCKLHTFYARELSQAVEELVDNAFQFSAEGSEVQVIASASHQILSIEVRDLGIGMSDDDFAAIAPFRRFVNSYSDDMAMGVGLSIARKLVSKMQGELTLSRRNPHGVAARIELPAFPLGIPS